MGALLKFRSVRFMALLAGLMLFVAALTTPLPASACGGSCGCDARQHNTGTRPLIAWQHQMLRWHIQQEFDDWELFLIDVFFTEHFLPSMMLMTQQLTAVAMQQMEMLGIMFDAKQQLETQRQLDIMKAEAHKDYHPSTGMCVFGTVTRSLAAAERRGEVASFVLGQRSQDRTMGHRNTVATEGPGQEKRDRLARFQTRYCNTHDNGRGLSDLCGGTTAAGIGPNRDVDWSRTVDRKLTLDLELARLQPDDSPITAPVAPTEDEAAIFALMENLYANDVPLRVAETTFRGAPANQGRVLALRALEAKRSVAINSFNAVVGMRAAGSPAGSPDTPLGTRGSSEDTAQYLRVVLRQLGMTDEAQITEMIGTRPSYFAQMDILTKKLYQRPEFYVELYDKPANVDRKMVSMQAIGLMQDFDTFKSYLRQEAILSVLTELELAREQSLVNEQLANPAHTGAVYEGP